ncbi:hypothetical protein [Cohaesibacter marisflavi]|uniref:hypothetical protein n=1 Tax=Cohaesibacter marisflavi TaxID=655353 RepID=UPI0029C7050A|nr:hypothetical protein [Cohaesibacter marisflavi]
MKNLGTFQIYQPSEVSESLKKIGAVFYQNEHEEDWYSLQNLTGIFVAVDDTGRVCSVAGDITALSPAGLTVIQLEDGDTTPEIGDYWDGTVFGQVPLTQADYTNAIQAMLDDAAKVRLYDSAATMSTYVSSTNEQWAAEAAAMVAWRDAVWLYAYAQLDLVQSGQRTQPTVDELLAELPTPTWPA